MDACVCAKTFGCFCRQTTSFFLPLVVFLRLDLLVLLHGRVDTDLQKGVQTLNHGARVIQDTGSAQRIIIDLCESDETLRCQSKPYTKQPMFTCSATILARAGFSLRIRNKPRITAWSGLISRRAGDGGSSPILAEPSIICIILRIAGLSCSKTNDRFQ